MRLIVCMLCLISFSAFGQSSKSQDILNKLSGKMRQYNSFYLEFSAHIKNSATGMNESEIGKGWVKGDKYYASYGDNTIISNGSKNWTVVKEDKSVYISDAGDEEESMNPKKLMTIWESGFKNKYDKETTYDNETVHVIMLYPKNPKEVDYHTIILYISKNKNELKKAVMKAKDGTVMSYSLKKFEANASVSDSKFVFDIKKYPGYSVIRD
ncbi:MAG: outer membrane lipoprotein carrier protein LolA [Bacteroidetes bacterium]|nr:MAG: outer membrane lipoprotein carrier protein LolA [Bacteroidota bacterium]